MLDKLQTLFRGQRETLSAEHKAILENNRGAVWFHAASVGEFEQARPLIERLRREQPQQKIVVTFFSPSGYEARKEYDMADGIYYLPFPTRRNARRFIKVLQPKMAIFVKYEFWPAYIRELSKQKIPTYSICAIFREEQYFFRWWGKGQRNLLKRFSHIFVQDGASKLILSEHGVHNASVAGDTRFDRMNEVLMANREKPTANLTPIAHFTEGCQRVIVAGSTWPEDEVLLTKYIDNLSLLNGDLSTKLILVPHELNEAHLHFIFNLFQGRFVRYSAANEMRDAVSRRNILQHAQVLVMDTMGLLSSTYLFGQVAYIGGGFGEGIHNTIEAAVYGKPVIFGPNYHHFREAKGLIEAGAARSIKNYSELEAALETALGNYENIGAKAAEYVQSELGASAKIYEQIFANGKLKMDN